MFKIHVVSLFKASLIGLACMFALAACTLPADGMPSTSGELKDFVQQPGPLLVLMLVASLASAFKQMAVARRAAKASGGTLPEVTLVSYFSDNWPETGIMLGLNVATWVTLFMTDSLNWAAIGWGYIANDLADSVTKEGRSVSMSPPPSPPKQ